MNHFMKRAVDLALQNVLEGGQPFGAVLVKDDQIIAEGVNELHKKFDVSGHAEMIAIRKAQEKLDTHDLRGYTMYASGYPCPMCFTAMCFSGIEDIYYCASLEDAKAAGLGKSGRIYEELQQRKIAMKHMPLEKQMEDPMEIWKNTLNT